MVWRGESTTAPVVLTNTVTSNATTSAGTELTTNTAASYTADGVSSVEIAWCCFNLQKTVASDSFFVRLYDGATAIMEIFVPASSGTSYGSAFLRRVHIPSAGSHVYTAKVQRNSGTGTVTVEANSSHPAQLSVQQLN